MGLCHPPLISFSHPRSTCNEHSLLLCLFTMVEYREYKNWEDTLQICGKLSSEAIKNSGSKSWLNYRTEPCTKISASEPHIEFQQTDWLLEGKKPNSVAVYRVIISLAVLAAIKETKYMELLEFYTDSKPVVEDF